MTIKEFFNKKNISKSDPFKGLEIKQGITMAEYKDIFELIRLFVFDTDNSYLPLTKEFAFRLAVMTIYLNLDNSDMPQEADELFKAIMCTPIYDMFLEKLEYKNQINLLRTGVDELTSYVVSNNTALHDLLVRIDDVITTLSSEEAINSLIQNVGISLLESAEQNEAVGAIQGDEVNAI